MKATGIVRRIDDFGRIAIPKEIRRLFFGTENTEGTPLEIFMDGDSIVLKKYKVEISDSEKIDFAIKELEKLKEHCCVNGTDLQGIIDNLKY